MSYDLTLEPAIDSNHGRADQLDSRRMRLGEILMARSLITPEQLQVALERQRAGEKLSVGPGVRNDRETVVLRENNVSGFGGVKLQRWISRRLVTYRLPD